MQRRVTIKPLAMSTTPITFCILPSTKLCNKNIGSQLGPVDFVTWGNNNTTQNIVILYSLWQHINLIKNNCIICLVLYSTMCCKPLDYITCYLRKYSPSDAPKLLIQFGIYCIKDCIDAITKKNLPLNQQNFQIFKFIVIFANFNLEIC